MPRLLFLHPSRVVFFLSPKRFKACDDTKWASVEERALVPKGVLLIIIRLHVRDGRITRKSCFLSSHHSTIFHNKASMLSVMFQGCRWLEEDNIH